jgi:hypothetical protein
VTINASSCSTTCYVTAWIDWNNDGDFNDINERIMLDRPVSGPSTVVTFPVPPGTVGGGSSTTVNARFRLYPSSTGGLAQPTGLVVNGEVEDYQWSFGPTAITLRTAATSNHESGIVLTLTLLLLGLVTTTISLRRRLG